MPAGQKTLDRDLIADAARQCACFQFRKASRTVTQMFDATLQPTGLRSTQLVILIMLAGESTISVARLAKNLVMDRSTVARNLKPLERQGFVVTEAGADRRTRLTRLTDAGREKLIEAVPYWQNAQSRVVTQLGDSRWQALLGHLNATVELLRDDA
jgi:DNA-binding MarR family transcriptional regulator